MIMLRTQAMPYAVYNGGQYCFMIVRTRNLSYIGVEDL